MGGRWLRHGRRGAGQGSRPGGARRREGRAHGAPRAGPRASGVDGGLVSRPAGPQGAWPAGTDAGEWQRPPRSWAGLRTVNHEAKAQRGWHHRILNALNTVPKRRQAQTRLLLAQIPYAATQQEAERLKAGLPTVVSPARDRSGRRRARLGVTESGAQATCENVYCFASSILSLVSCFDSTVTFCTFLPSVSCQTSS